MPSTKRTHLQYQEEDVVAAMAAHMQGGLSLCKEVLKYDIPRSMLKRRLEGQETHVQLFQGQSKNKY